MTVMPFSQGGVFGPADIKAMSIALDEVCSKLALGAGQDEREFLAKRVIAIACRGERDSAALRDGVLQEAAVSAWRGLGPSGIIGAGLCPSAPRLRLSRRNKADHAQLIVLPVGPFPSVTIRQA